jgi:two-component system nitrogen regulation sensor histidine kinase NtrY
MQKVGFPDIEISLDVPDEPVETVFDERMISQALINVIKNAAEAIEAVEEERSGKVQVRLFVLDRTAIIDVIDNGKGLPEENRQRLLEPYMTTRAKGTGLGLPIVRKIFEDHGGSIELMDAPDVINGGQGAMMRLVLPMVESGQNETGNKQTEQV